MTTKTYRYTKGLFAAALAIALAASIGSFSQAHAATEDGSLAPATASEATASATASANEAATFSAQSSKKQTIWIVTGEKSVIKRYNGNDKLISSKTTTSRYAYAKNGLLKKSTVKSSASKGKTVTKYYYKAKRLVRVTKKNTRKDESLKWSKYTCSYAKKGRVVKAKLKTVYSDGSTSPAKRAQAVYDKRGRLSKLKEVSYVTVHSTAIGGKTSTSYLPDTRVTKYKKKRGQTLVKTDDRTSTYVLTSRLDEHGNVKNKYGSNSYDEEGKMVGSYAAYGGLGASWTDADTEYTYKQIEVPKSMAVKIEAQQWAILNGNSNNAFGIID